MRASQGETLSSEDRAFYEAGLCHLHRDEIIHTDTSELESLAQKIAVAVRKNADLDGQRQVLEKRVAQLQARRSDRHAESAVRNE
jgi:hypothetical protein